MVGVAGAGKTTMLAAVASAFEASGCQVLGTATAGQAARTLADGAALPTSSTLASLVGRLDRGQLLLDERSVVILDEAGMTDDVDLARLATHAQLAGAKLIVVGDHRQLGAVGPGGALAALVARHPDAVHHLDHNRRQPNPEERAALEQLRDSDINRAVDWYAGHDRIRPVEDRDVALRAAVDGWAADTATGAEVALLAWRRANVAELNSGARAWMTATGRLTGPELDVDGVSYRAGDRVIALAPDRDAGLVTSQRAIVTTVDVDIGTVMLRTGDGRQVALGGGQLGADRLGHAYATTVHRFQGSTVERAHLFADGGGRELAYVAMSRARHTSTAYVVADDLGQAAEDRLAALVDAERSRLDQETRRLHTTLDVLDQRSVTASRRWQRAASEHTAATRSQQRLGRALDTTRRRLEQPDPPDRATLLRRTPANWQPAPRHAIEPELPATHEAPGL